MKVLKKICDLYEFSLIDHIGEKIMMMQRFLKVDLFHLS